jgi:hypothetical protein
MAAKLLVVTDDTTREEIEVALAHVTDTLRRMPEHWVDRRAKLHETIDALLTDWMEVKS